MLTENTLKLYVSLILSQLFIFPAFSQIQTGKNRIDASLDGGYWVYTIDFDEDADVDILAASLREGLKWYKNNGQGSFARQHIANFKGAWTIHANDFDNDGDLDVVACSPDLDETAWFERKGNGTFVKHVVDDESRDPHSVFSADLDNDNDFDIIVAAWESRQVVLWENRGAAQFRKHILDKSIGSAHSVYAADLDSDGDLEILAGSGGTTAYWRNDGNLAFKKRQVGTRGAFSVFAADIDGDGKRDLLRNQRNNGDIDWFQNLGEDFTQRTVARGLGETWSVHAADLDLDGDTDVITAAFASNKVSIWVNDGQQNFSETIVDDDLVRPRAVSAADLDGDRDPDIVAVTRTDDVVWYEILGSPQPPTLSVIQPNGGETIEAGSQFTIRWDHTGTINAVNLEYSLDSDLGWSTIVANAANTGSFEWQVPNVESDQVLIRISRAGDQSIADSSNGRFSIVQSQLTLTAPNGGEQWFSDSTQEITWNSNGVIETVSLEYSRDNGSTWQIISARTQNDGSFDWRIPVVQSDQALVRIADVSDGTPSDVSDTPFEISQPSLVLISPNGGERWFGGSSQTIAWSSLGNIEFVNLEYSRDDGLTWIPIVNDLANEGSFFWNVPNVRSEEVRVRIEDAVAKNPSDVSDSTFTIIPSSATLTAPNGGENWFGGTPARITWQSTGAIENLKIEYSLNAGTDWQTVIESTPNTGSYDWIIPNIPTTTAMVRLVDLSDGTVYDLSNSVFAITLTSVTLLAPNGGETWFGGSRQAISWSHVGPIDFVTLEYSEDGGENWTIIAENVSNTNAYEWILPVTESHSALVRVSDSADDIPSDQSDGAFTILGASLTLKTPNGGEEWLAGTTQTIRWESSGPVDSVMLEYSSNAGEDWNTITERVPNSGAFEWTVPAVQSDLALVRVSRGMGAQPLDISDAVFSITKPAGTLTLTSPNGGEFWSGETQKQIRWSSSGSIQQVRLEFSPDRGATWQQIASELSNTGHHDWRVPDIHSTEVLIRISDLSGTTSDVSDGPFAIIGSSLRLLSPNGGEEWTAGGSHEVRWSSTGIIARITLDYSLNNGLSWQTLARGLPNSGSYLWAVPQLASQSALLRISDSADNNPQDVSDTMFSIVGNVTGVRIVEGAEEQPERFQLFQNYPNPFNPTTTIRFAVPDHTMVKLTVYNFVGQEVATLVSEEMRPGMYKVEWRATDLPSGIYFYQMKAGEFTQTRRLTLLK